MFPELYEKPKFDFITVAHRGASAYRPENTMAAFETAVDMGAQMIELDVMTSRDGIPVVFHDAELQKHTDGNGLLSDHTLSELKKLDAGSWFDEKYSGERILALEEVLDFAAGKIALNIEIKTESVTDQIEGGIEFKCLNLVKKNGMEPHVLFSSFDPRSIRHLRQLDAELPVALLYDKKRYGKRLPSDLLSELNADAFNCRIKELSKKLKKDLEDHKIPVFVYTVNKRKQMRKMIEWGAAGIITDKPDLLNEVGQELTHSPADE